ncbi:MAG: carbon-nitrogen hydrolase family protein [Anaerolineae bacterium]|nr:carbon-nitrogen hydrolase family protein [Anaerolineae bacterium]
MSFRIAVVQQNGNPGKPNENRTKALNFATQALAQDADVILFHEELLVGYTPNLRQLAEPADGPTTQAFQKLLFCYDGDFREMTRAYANLGCAVVFWINNRNSRGYTEVKDLASRNSMIIAASCCCGPDEDGRECGGGSNITDEDGKPLAEIWGEEGIILADVSPEKALAQRGENPWYRGQRPELYYGKQIGESLN